MGDDVPQHHGPGGTRGEGSAAQAAAMLTGDATRTAAARRLSPPRSLPGVERLTRLAAQLLGVASAQVSLLTDVEAVASGTGPAAGRPGERKPLAEALCALTAASGSPMEITDARADSRVAGLPPVTAGAVGSYLGVPLTIGGETVGVMCVAAAQTRTWDERDVDVLEQVAAAVGAELELAALDDDYRTSRALLEAAVTAAGVGTFAFDLVTGVLTLDDRLLQLSALTRATFSGRPEDVYAHLHPDDVEEVVDRVRAAADGGGTYAAQYRVVQADGSHRWLAARGSTLPGPDGTPTRLLGAVYDVTGARAAGERIEAVLDAMAVGYLHLDGDWVISYANREAERVAGYTREEMLGSLFWEQFPAAVGGIFETSYRHAVAAGEAAVFDAYYPAPVDAWVEVRAIPEGEGLGLYFLDVTARTQAQQAAQESAARLYLLGAVSTALTDTLDAERAVARLAQLVVPALGDWCVVTLVDDDTAASTFTRSRASRAGDLRRGLRDVGWWHRDAALQPLVEAYTACHLGELGDDAPLLRALREARPVHLTDATRAVSAVLTPGGEAVALLRELAPASASVFPLRGRGRTVGLLTLFAGPDRVPLTDVEVATAGEVAARAGLALDSARLYRQQRDLAEGLQRSLLSEPPEPDHGQIVVRYVPAAEAAQVGG
ncbi:GAF domain-containing protein, partial [Kineococcus siccus]|uniref:GAF domain-containing protein n=1 Tax=Kineococcus siccus TaxID=2696567 RepID=UPI001F0E8908